jgi:hypothetical protein
MSTPAHAFRCKAGTLSFQLHLEAQWPLITCGFAFVGAGSVPGPYPFFSVAFKKAVNRAHDFLSADSR